MNNSKSNESKQLILGNEAVARGAYEAGVVVVSSYPGTPSTEITERIARYDDIFSEWAPNEKVSLEVALGASIGGGRALCAMKHVGLNVASDPLFTASYTGVGAGLLICVADDPGMHSSQNEQDSRNYAAAAKLPMLEPADSSECYEYTKKAFELSERFDTPVLLRLTTRISHSQSLVETGERQCPPLKNYEKNPSKYVMMPAMAQARRIVVEERSRALEAYAEETDLNKVVFNDKKIGIISSGIAYQAAKEALGKNASYLKLGMLNPLPRKMIQSFAEQVEICYVVEELDPYIENFCKSIGVKTIGKEVFSPIGEYTANKIRKVILDQGAEVIRIDEKIPGRPPVMCAGCPHRSVFFVLKQLGLTVCGDIGCYTLGALPPLSAIDTCVCMGASIGVAHGMELARGRTQAEKTVAVIGDSTFIHSGITGLIDVVYNKGTSTVIILDNSITGMTGHQENPTTGKTIKGEPAVQVDLKKLCEAVGVKRVRIIDPFNINELTQVIKEETAAPEVSVIIAQRPCALLKTAKHDTKSIINKEICKECGKCLKIGCPAISKKDGKVIIDRSQCGGCNYCLNICSFNAINKAEKEEKQGGEKISNG